MKKTTIIISLVAGVAMTSCVSLSEMEALQAKYDQTSRQYSLTQQELLEIKEENASLTRQNQALASDMSDVALRRDNAERQVDSLTRRIEQLRHHYDTTMENYMQQLTGKNRDLSRANKMLEQRTRELNEKEQGIRIKEQKMIEQQKDLEEQLASLAQSELAANEELAAKQRELESLRQSVQKALVGFADKGLDVNVKDGKVYVSMADKLLFPSGSWEVSPKGLEALKSLAQVLEANPDLNVVVEGHTDNDAYHGSSAVKDNWDLSVMRATAIVKLLLKQEPRINPARVEAAGHAEYAPKVKNTSAANKAVNRRTEIIIAPRLKEIINLLN